MPNFQEAGYAGSTVRHWDGDFEITRSSFSEPDGFGGKLVDFWVDNGDGTESGFFNVEVKSLESSII